MKWLGWSQLPSGICTPGRLGMTNLSRCSRRQAAPADDRVEMSMYQRACGYEVKTEKVYRNSDGSITRVETTEHIPADVGAAAIWLKDKAA